MNRHLLLTICLFLLVFFNCAQNAFAQTTKNDDGYAVFTFEKLQGATLADLAPEVGNGITSYSVTISCEHKDLFDLTCTGDTMSSSFYTYLSKTAAKRCMCYFDKIIADGKPLKGFVIEGVTK